MRYIKTLGLVAVTAIAALAFAVPASATQLTHEGKVFTGEVAAEVEGGGVVTHNAFETFTCQISTAKGSVEQHGPSVTASGKLSSWNLTSCNTDVKVKQLGSLEIHATGSGNGTITSTGMEIESINTNKGVTCIYTTNNTTVGTLTGSKTENATVDLNSAAVPRTGGSFLCGPSGTITGSYDLTAPSTLYVD